MNEKNDRVISQIKKLPINFEKIKKLLDQLQLSSADLSHIAIEFAETCGNEQENDYDHNWEKKTGEKTRVFTPHLPQVIELLLSFGMDPNDMIDNNNIMSEIQWVDYEDYAAKTLKILLEHGGNPNLIVEGESLFDFVAFKVSFDMYEQEFEWVIKFWLVLMAYGGYGKDGVIPLKMEDGYGIEIFRDYNNYSYSVEYTGQISGYNGCWTMHIFDKMTGIEVASYS